MGADLKESTSVARRMKSGPAFVHQKKRMGGGQRRRPFDCRPLALRRLRGLRRWHRCGRLVDDGRVRTGIRSAAQIDRHRVAKPPHRCVRVVDVDARPRVVRRRTELRTAVRDVGSSERPVGTTGPIDDDPS
jgi:hypothetical protein